MKRIVSLNGKGRIMHFNQIQAQMKNQKYKDRNHEIGYHRQLKIGELLKTIELLGRRVGGCITKIIETEQPFYSSPLMDLDEKSMDDYAINRALLKSIFIDFDVIIGRPNKNQISFMKETKKDSRLLNELNK